MEKENIVISVGAINPLKRYDFIVDTLGKVKKYIRPTLVLIGNAVNLEYMRSLEHLAKKNKVKQALFIASPGVGGAKGSACSFLVDFGILGINFTGIAIYLVIAT